jgi:hypothetical protein
MAGTGGPRPGWKDICDRIRAPIHDCEYFAINEANESQMPGRDMGPADAYRHVLLAAELTRRWGPVVAMCILEHHEWTAGPGQTPEAEAMDRDNNIVGIRIGLSGVCTWEEVVQEARKTIRPNDPFGETGGGRWLPEPSWRQNPGIHPTRPPTSDRDRIPTRTPDGNFDPRINWPSPRFPPGPYPYKWRPLNGPIPGCNEYDLPACGPRQIVPDCSCGPPAEARR